MSGRIEHLGRAFDVESDVAHFQGPAFRDLKTGHWGIRYYQPVPGKRPVAIVVRVSNEIQTQADRVPFHAQVRDILAQLAPDEYVAVLYWDCQTARDTRKRGRFLEQVTRPGFEAACAAALERRYTGMWVWHSSRIVRSLYGGYRLDQVADIAGFVPKSVTDHISRDWLGITATMNAMELRNIANRTLTGRETTATVHGLPPTGRPTAGWLRVGQRTKGDRAIVHDPAIQAHWTALLTGLRFEGWTWTEGASYLTTRAVPHQRRGDTVWHSGQVARLLGRDNYWTGVVDLALPVFNFQTNSWSTARTSRKRHTLQVPPAVLRDPVAGERPVTADDLAYIRAHAAGGPRPGSPRGTHTRPLSGVVRCAVCGMTMTAKPHPTQWAVYRTLSDGTRRKYPVTLKNPPWRFECPGAASQRRGGRGPCPRRPLRFTESRLEASIWALLVAQLSDPGNVTREAREALEQIRRDPAGVTLTDADARLEALARQEILWLDRQDAGEVSPQAAGIKLEAIRLERRQLEEATAEAAAYRAQLAEREAAFALLAAYAGRIDWGRLASTLRDFDPARRPEAIRLMVQQAWVQRDGTLELRVRWAGVVAVSEGGPDGGPGGDGVGAVPWRSYVYEGNGQSPILTTFTLIPS